jgi:hypothetical protein
MKVSKRRILKGVVKIRRSLGIQKRVPKPVSVPKARKPVPSTLALPLRGQLVLRFLLRQADIIPGVNALYWRIRRNPLLHEAPRLVQPTVLLKPEPFLRITGNRSLDLELALNVFRLNYFSEKARKIEKQIRKGKRSPFQQRLRKRQALLFERGAQLVRRNRQILIEFLYPNKP